MPHLLSARKSGKLWQVKLQQELDELHEEGLTRALATTHPVDRFVERDGAKLVNLAGNDYLALAQHRRLAQAAVDAIRRHGVGATASRLICGHREGHERLEQRLAVLKKKEAALFFPTGFMANLAVLGALARRGDRIYLDKHCHGSLIDAAAASGATWRRFGHFGYEQLERLLSRARASDVGRRLIVTDGVFSMDGDVADLPRLCDMADRHGAILVVDDAHGTGVLGAQGLGLAEVQDVEQRIDVVIGTASKAMAGLGGFVAADRVVIETLVNRGRSFIYTTAAPPAQVAVAEAALDVFADEPWRRRRLAEMSLRLRDAVDRLGLPTVRSALPTPIIPIVAGSVAATAALAQHLEDAGFYAPAIRPPTVAPATSRVRLALRTDLLDADIESLCAALERWRRITHGD